MQKQLHRRMQKGAFLSSLFLAGFSLILSYLLKAGLLYSVGKAVIIFVVMYFICRIVILTWDKVSRQSDSSSIKTTMDVLDDLEEKGIKVTYNPLQEPGDDETAEVIPGQINMDSLSQRNKIND